MFCSKCGVSLPDDAIVCYKCATSTNVNFQNQPKQVHERVAEKQRPIIVKNTSNLGSALVLLALLGGIGFYWYQQNKAHEYFDFKVTDKGVSVSSDGLKSSEKYQISNNPNSVYTAPVNAEKQVPSNSSSGNEIVACQIVNSRRTVNGHEHCDAQDCDNDASTATYTIDVGDNVTLTGRKTSSSLPSVGSWIEVSAEDGTQLYVAETKLSCQ